MAQTFQVIALLQQPRLFRQKHIPPSGMISRSGFLGRNGLVFIQRLPWHASKTGLRGATSRAYLPEVHHLLASFRFQSLPFQVLFVGIVETTDEESITVALGDRFDTKVRSSTVKTPS